jgi:hypothetical protein
MAEQGNIQLQELTDMDQAQEAPTESKTVKTDWARYVLMALAAEKIIQHIFVTLAFYFNWGNIDATVAVNPDILMVLGVVITALFILSLWGLYRQRKWSVDLLITLALVDMIGEFIAQGTIAIQINVSFMIATVLLILAMMYRRRGAFIAG